MDLDSSNDFGTSHVETLSLEEAFNEGLDVSQNKLDDL